MPEGAQILVFTHDVKPIWEDEANVGGGRFIIRAKRGFGNKIWEDLLTSYLIDEEQVIENVCGVVSHSKKQYI
jgi:translation initiation factor 4E